MRFDTARPARRLRRTRAVAFGTALVFLPGCARAPDAALETASTPPPAVEQAPQDAWWSSLAALCGQAFPGRVVSQDPADASLAGQSLVMHVRRCEDRRIEIPFHVGDDRSRTWVLTRTDSGIQLKHDHRHEDGSEDAVTQYGGHTAIPGTEVVQFFPADPHSKTVFRREGLDASVDNIWSIDVVPDTRFTYALRRPARFFRADFDLTTPVDPPPAPWGHESR